MIGQWGFLTSAIGLPVGLGVKAFVHEDIALNNLSNLVPSSVGMSGDSTIVRG